MIGNKLWKIGRAKLELKSETVVILYDMYLIMNNINIYLILNVDELFSMFPAMTRWYDLQIRWK